LIAPPADAVSKSGIRNVNDINVVVVLVFPLFGREIVDLEVIIDFNANASHHKDSVSVKAEHLHALSSTWQLTFSLKLLVTETFFNVNVRS